MKLVLWVSAVILLITPGIAVAKVNVPNDLHGHYDGCIAKFRAAGFGGVVDKLDKSSREYRIERTKTKGNSHSEADDRHGARSGSPSGGTLYWNPDDDTVFPDGVADDKCATLFHEMSHLNDYDDGNNRPDVPCNKQTQVSIAETKASRAENDYRRSQPDLKDKIRKKYGNDDLPPDGTPCDKPPPYKRPGGCNVSGCGISNGDPHLVTFDQARYDLQAVGEFVLARSSSRVINVQVRQSALPGSKHVSVNRAVVAKVGNDRLGIYMGERGPATLVNGQPGLTNALTRFDDGSVGITWPDGSQLVAHPIGTWGLSIAFSLADVWKGKVEGILGDFDGDKADDLSVPSGAPLTQPVPFATMYPGYADAWRITQAESLFDYGAGESTTTFTDRSFPAADIVVADLPGRHTAEAICRQSGVTDPVSLQNCILDVALSGQPVFATDAALSQGSIVDSAAQTLTVPAGGTAKLTFPATAGQKIFIDITSSTLPSQCGLIALRAPDETFLGGGCIIDGTGFVDGTVLPVNGAYSLTIDPAGKEGGVVRLRIHTVTDDVGTMSIGDKTMASITGPGAVSRKTFTGTAGQKVFVDVTSSTLVSQCGVLALRAPDGSFVNGGCIINGTGFIDGTVLPVTGTYVIVLDASERGTGTAQLILTSATDQRQTASVGAGQVTATISQAGAVSRITFAGTQGQKIAINVLSSTLPSQCGVLTLRGPDDAFVAGGCIINGGGAMENIVLPKTGTYTLTVDPAERATGNARLSIGS